MAPGFESILLVALLQVRAQRVLMQQTTSTAPTSTFSRSRRSLL